MPPKKKRYTITVACTLEYRDTFHEMARGLKEKNSSALARKMFNELMLWRLGLERAKELGIVTVSAELDEIGAPHYARFISGLYIDRMKQALDTLQLSDIRGAAARNLDAEREIQSKSGKLPRSETPRKRVAH